MNGFLYLVILSHGMDGIPIRMFDDSLEAFEFAKTLSWDAPQELLQRLELPGCDSPCVITVTAFQNGLPISRVIVRNFDDELDDQC